MASSIALAKSAVAGRLPAAAAPATDVAVAGAVGVPAAPMADIRGGLATRSFLGLLATQFFVALNDNMFRWLIVPIGKGILGAEHADRALSMGLVCLVLPTFSLACRPAIWPTASANAR